MISAIQNVNFKSNIEINSKKNNLVYQNKNLSNNISFKGGKPFEYGYLSKQTYQVYEAMGKSIKRGISHLPSMASRICKGTGELATDVHKGIKEMYDEEPAMFLMIAGYCVYDYFFGN